MKDISQSDIENNLPLVTRKDFIREVKVGDIAIGQGEVVIMAGPCTIESKAQVREIAQAVKDAGARVLRGGAFKPLTFPYGDPLAQPDSDSNEPAVDRKKILTKSEMFEKAEARLSYLKEVGDELGMPVISEITYAETLPMMEKYVDMFQVGYRHMFNMDLIDALSRSTKSIMIKRHYGESLRSLLGVCEHFDARGKTDYVVCERGITTAHTHRPESRAILDVQAVPAMKEYAPSVPVIIDPSHATFRRDYVAAMSRAGIAAGADGMLVEVHFDPENAWVDPLQALGVSDFKALMIQLDGIAQVLGRKVLVKEGSAV